MPETPQKKKIKRAPFRRVSKLFLCRFWLRKDHPDYLVGRNSLLFDDNDLIFVKSYEHLHDYYIKQLDGQKPLIKHAEGMMYNDLLLHLKRGHQFTLKEYAKDYDVIAHTVLGWIDSLENVNLLHRERSRDGSEHTTIYVPHTPLSLHELRAQHYTLLERQANKYIQTRRRVAGRNKRDWMPQAFSWKRLLKAFENSTRRAETFENIVGDIVHRNITDKYYSRGHFLADVIERCGKQKLNINEEHHKIALEIKDYIQRII
jgi:hypothetical protein